MHQTLWFARDFVVVRSEPRKGGGLDLRSGSARGLAGSHFWVSKRCTLRGNRVSPCFSRQPQPPNSRNEILLKRIVDHGDKQSGFVEDKARFSAELKSLLIEILAGHGSQPVWSVCGQKCLSYSPVPERRCEWVPLWGLAVFFVYAMRRVNCWQCGVRPHREIGCLGRLGSTRFYNDEWRR